MGRDYSVIKTNVGNDVGDTSTAMASLIGRYINRRYFETLRAINFDYINEDYTITLVDGTQDYSLATDFKNELYATDGTKELTRVTMQDLAENYPDTLATEGTVYRYVIFTKDDGTKKIRFHYVPNAAGTINLPYYVWPAELSADTDEPIAGLEDVIEVGATADAWRYKRQFGKARDMEVLYQKGIADYVWKQYNNQNQIYQFKPATFSRDNLV